MSDEQPPADDLRTAQQLFQQLAIMLQQSNSQSTNNNSSNDNFTKARLREPDIFTGDHCDQQVVDGWLRSIERHRDFYKWDSTRTVSFAVTFLTSHADIWYRTLEQQDAAPTLWVEFKHSFIAKFRPGNAYDLARDKLVALKQTTTIADYIQKFANTIILIPEMHRLEAYDAFMRGLKNTHDLLFAELRSVELDDRNMDLAYRKAAAFESSHVFRDANGKIISAPVRPAVPYHSHYNHNNDPMDLDVIHQRQQFHHSSAPSTSSWRKNKFNNNNNYKHNNNNYKKNNNNVKGGYPPCRLCSQMGHGISNCPLLDVVIAAVNSNKNGANKKFAVNSLQGSDADSTPDNNHSNNGSINNKNNSSNHYSPLSSFNNHTSTISPTDSMGNNTVIINDDPTVHNQSTAAVSTDVSKLTTSSTVPITQAPVIPMELVPVVLPSKGHHELNYVMQLNSLSGPLPLYHGVVGTGNMLIKILIDSGASDNYVSSKLANSIASRLTTVPGREVETADGGITVINQEAMLDLNLGGYTCQVSSYVFPTKFDLILGRTWLKAHCPMPNWINDQWTLGNGDDAILLTPIQNFNGEFNENYNAGDLDNGRPQLSYLISKKQVNNYLRDGASGYLLYMKDDMLSEPTSSRHVFGEGHEGNNWISDFLKEFNSVFSDALPGLPKDSGFQHVINLQPDAKPVNRAPYKMSPAELDELQKQLKELLDLGLIRKSTSPFGSPVLFVRKPDGSMRMCIDYRALNSLTIRNSNPLPRIDECFDRLQGASFFSSLDLKSGYHQIRIQESDIPKTAFNTRYGKWEFLVLPFGLCNAPPSFQAQMNSVLGDYIDKFCLVYLDDICIFSRSLEEHKKHLRLVFEKLKEHNLIVNTKKCTFAQRELTFLGFKINDKGILPSPDKVKAIQNWKILTNVQEVRSFIGLAQHYRRFIPSFAAIAAPLTDLTKGTGSKRRPVTWTPECDISFNKIKKLLTSSPVLLLPDMSKPFRIECDASDCGVGAVLLQPVDHNADLSKASSWHPVAYESKKLSSAERNYPAQERELLGIIHALRTWECFIDGCPGGYQVFTDHQPLQYLRSQAKPTPRLVRWLSELESYSPDIVYKTGKSNIVPDLLSRVDGVDSEPAVDSFEPKYLYAADIHAAADDNKKDLSLELQQDWPLLYRFNYDQKVQTPKLKSLLEGERDNFVVRDQKVFRKVKLKVDTGNQKDGEQVFKLKEIPFVPFIERVDLVEKYHAGFGHAGVKNMVNMFESRYWWPTMRRDITFWIKTCTACQVNSAKSSKHQDVMHPLDVPEAFARWHLDFIGELPTTIKGNKWIITAVDSLTNWPIARAVPVASAEAVADFLYEEIVMRFGCPAEIITDRGANLTSNIVKSYVHRMGTNHKLTSAFHPRTNSKVERFNGIIKPMLRKYVNGAIHRWDDFLDTSLWACRIRKHTTTGNSPFKLTYGRDPCLPGDPLRPYIDSKSAKDPRTIADYTARELEALGQLRAAAEFRVKAVNQRDKEKWDAVIKPVTFESGDLVMITNEGRYGLEPIYRGPYVVLQYFPEFGTYKLETVEGKPLDSLIHVDRLKKAHGDKPVEPWYEPSSLLRRPVVSSELSSDFSGPSYSSRPMNKPIVVKSSTTNSSGGYVSYPQVDSSFDDTDIVADSSSGSSIELNDNDKGTVIIDNDIVDDDDDIIISDFIISDDDEINASTQNDDNAYIQNNDGQVENFIIQDNDAIVQNDNAIEDNNNIQDNSDPLNDNEDFIHSIVQAVLEYTSKNKNEVMDNEDNAATRDEAMVSKTGSTCSDVSGSTSFVDEVVSIPDVNEAMVDITSPSSVPHVVDDQLSINAEIQTEQNNEVNMEHSSAAVDVDFDDNASQYFDASSDDDDVEHVENSENFESNILDYEMTCEQSSSSNSQELIITAPVYLPPPTPRLKPIVTKNDFGFPSGRRNSVAPPPPARIISQSPPPQSDFTFTRPVVSSVPVQEPLNSATSPIVTDTHQFRFSDVPGVTSSSRGGNVEQDISSSTEDIIEDTPEFIRRWNENKTKRFRPVLPRSNRLSKKRRLGNATKPPDL